jgi:phosphoribosylaminoimidazolecarboxamide formyltransferase/IMP cyclohydrolase
MLDGRVKTLHPKIHAGILHRRDVAAHVAQMTVHGWPGIDLVVVNLYPFESVIEKPQTSFEEAVENIDIGGPCLLRASAKNHAHVAVLCDPADYGPFLEEMEKTGGSLTPSFRRALAQKAFGRVSAYDKAISDYLASKI